MRLSIKPLFLSQYFCLLWQSLSRSCNATSKTFIKSNFLFSSPYRGCINKNNSVSDSFCTNTAFHIVIAKYHRFTRKLIVRRPCTIGYHVCHRSFLRRKVRKVQNRRAWHDSPNPYNRIPKPTTHCTPNRTRLWRTCPTSEMRNQRRHGIMAHWPHARQ
jgi:hypothetical protein